MALCHQIHQPLTHLLASLDGAHAALRQRLRDDAGDQSALQAARCLAEARATAQHLLRVVGDVHEHAHHEPQRARRLDLRAVVRAAAAMAQPGGAGKAGIVVDAPEAVCGSMASTSRLVHVFLPSVSEAVTDETATVASVRSDGGEVFVELCHGGPGPFVEAGRRRRQRRRPVAHALALGGATYHLRARRSHRPLAGRSVPASSPPAA